MKAEDVVSVTEQLTMRCPFCGGTFSAGTEDTEGHSVLLHTMPTCATFDGLAPIDFLAAVRKRGAN